MIIPFSPVIAENPGVIIGEDMLDEGKLGEPIVVEDLFSFKVDEWEFGDDWHYRQTEGYYFNLSIRSGIEKQYMYVYCTFFNESTQPLSYDKYISNAKLIFKEGYEYLPVLVTHHSPNYEHDYVESYPTQPLMYVYPQYVFEVPNLIETSKDQLVFYITVNGTENSFKFR